MTQGQEGTCGILHLLKVLGSGLKEGIIEKDPEGRPGEESYDLSDLGREEKKETVRSRVPSPIGLEISGHSQANFRLNTGAHLI